MDSKFEEPLDHFASHVNWNIPHPLDWERFFDFIAVAHRNPRSRPDANELETHLLKYHPGLENVREFVYFYEQALHLLKHLNVRMRRPGPDPYERRENR